MTAPAAGSLLGVRVLTVEDQDDSRELVRIVLEREGARVASASSVKEARQLLHSQTFDIMIADLGLPDEDGYALIRSLRTLPSPSRHTLAVALTAYAGDQYRAQALAAGYDAYIAKPIEPSKLAAILAQVIAR